MIARRWKHVFAVIAVIVGGLHAYAANEPGVYASKEHGFSIRFPSSWEIREGADGATVKALSPPQGKSPGQFRPYIRVDVETIPPTMSLDDYVQRGFNNARSAMGAEFKAHRSGRQMISHTRARWWIISYRADSVTVKGFLFLVVNGGRAYRIMSFAPLDQYATFKDVFGKSVSSIVFE